MMARFIRQVKIFRSDQNDPTYLTTLNSVAKAGPFYKTS